MNIDLETSVIVPGNLDSLIRDPFNTAILRERADSLDRLAMKFAREEAAQAIPGIFHAPDVFTKNDIVRDSTWLRELAGILRALAARIDNAR